MSTKVTKMDVTIELTTLMGKLSVTQCSEVLEFAKSLTNTTTKANTNTTKATTKPKVEEPKRRKTKFVELDGHFVQFVNDGTYIPKKVWNGITYSLRESGATFDDKAKVWVFADEKSANKWFTAQEKRDKAYAKKSK